MKNLFSLLGTALVVSFIFISVTYTACNTDKCKGVICGNGGTCNDGKCICPDGYSGTSCEIADPCNNVVCLNNGVCNSGLCDCPFEYTGDSCQKETRADYYMTYVGTYVDNADTTKDWRIRVSADSADVKHLKLESMNLVGTVFSTYKVVLTSDHSFDLPEQTEKSRTSSGSGSIGTTGLLLHITQTTPNGEHNISYIMFPQ